jgi:hypothetical protein
LDTVYAACPGLLLFAAAAVFLHVLSGFVPRFRFALTVLNVLLHAAAAAAILTVGGNMEDFVLLLLISAFAALLVGEREETEKNARAAEEKGETEEKEGTEHDV